MSHDGSSVLLDRFGLLLLLVLHRRRAGADRRRWVGLGGERDPCDQWRCAPGRGSGGRGHHTMATRRRPPRCGGAGGERCACPAPAASRGEVGDGAGDGTRVPLADRGGPGAGRGRPAPGQHRTVTVQTLLGAVAAYLQIAVAYAFAFQALDAGTALPLFGVQVPTTSYMYASLTALSTLGYGDLVPVTELGRLLAVSEAIVGQVFLVTFVAMLASRYATKPVSPRTLSAAWDHRRTTAPPEQTWDTTSHSVLAEAPLDPWPSVVSTTIHREHAEHLRERAAAVVLTVIRRCSRPQRSHMTGEVSTPDPGYAHNHRRRDQWRSED